MLKIKRPVEKSMLSRLRMMYYVLFSQANGYGEFRFRFRALALRFICWRPRADPAPLFFYLAWLSADTTHSFSLVLVTVGDLYWQGKR